MEFFNDTTILNSIDGLLNLGVKPYFKEEIVEENIFNGKTVVVTGSLKSFSRAEIKEKLQSLGSKVYSSVSKKRIMLLLEKIQAPNITKQ